MRNTILEAMTAALNEANESNYTNPLLGFEFVKSGFGLHIKSLTLSLRELSYKAIDDFLSKEYGSYSFSRIYLLENKEWEIRSFNGFTIFNTWGKLLKLIKDNNITENGQYVIVNRAQNTTVEVKLYNTHSWLAHSYLTISSNDVKAVIKEIGECGKASDLEIIYLPPYSMWKVDSWDTYPDDPGCGIYSICVNVFDKATGVKIAS